MAANSGRNIIVRLKNDATPTAPGAVASAFVAILGLLTKSLTFNREIVDVTNSDSVGAWRELLTGGGVQSLSVGGSGIANDKTSVAVFQDAIFDGSLRDGDVVVPGVGTFAGKFAVSSFALSGEHNGAIKVEAALESSGAITFTVEP